MKKLLVAAVLALSTMSFAAPPGPGPGPGPGRMGRGLGAPLDDEERTERMEDAARRARTMYVVAIAEALELNEADALKLAEKLRASDEKRAPIRLAMHEAMRSVRSAAAGEQAALAQVDANVQKVLDGRAQMAALDKELFATLAKDLSPQKRAKLALVLAKMGQMHRGGRTGMGHQGMNR